MRKFDPKHIAKRLYEPRRSTEVDLRRQQLEPLTRGLSWKAKQRVCQQHAAALLDQWEQKFIYDLDRSWWHREHLEPKQAKKLNMIYERLVFEHGCHHRVTYGE